MTPEPTAADPDRRPGRALAIADARADETKSVEERLDLLEVKQEDAVVKGDIPGSFRIPGTGHLDADLRLRRARLGAPLQG